MQARFLHFADCHLGYKQYGSSERYNDFARAFLHVIETAVAKEVDFVVLAGDLFHKRSIDALTLNQAISGLERLQKAGIPCLAVEGNHEHAYYQDVIGWMEFLAQRGLLLLLNGDFKEGAIQLAPYAGRKGAYHEPKAGLRVYGMRYLGSATPRAIEAYAQALTQSKADGVEYTIFIAHAGVEGVLAEQAGGVSYRQWSLLQPHIDYLALGHVHQPFVQENWIFNPGSTETCSTMEASWPERGYFLVDVDTANGENKHTATLGVNKRRPFVRVRVKTDLHTSPDALYDHCRQLLQRRARDLGGATTLELERPVAELQLTGALPFERSALDIEVLEGIVTEAFNPLIALVRNLTHSTDFAIDVEEGVNRRVLEEQIVTELLERDARFRGQSEAWARLVLNIKTLALDNAGPESILEELATRSRLLADSGSDASARTSTDDRTYPALATEDD